MIRKNPNLKTHSNESFIEADQLVGSHRRPVAWMLAIQVILLGFLLTWLASPSTLITILMLTLLGAFLLSANWAWSTAFLSVVITGRIIQTNGYQEFFVDGGLLLNCVSILLMLVASFRYTELRSYSRAFNLGKTYRLLEHTHTPSAGNVLTTVIGQIVRRHWYHSLLAIFAAYMLLWSIPTTKQWTQKYWLDPTGGRFIFLCLALFLGWFLCRSVFSIWDWFSLTPNQADVAMRSWANREFWSATAGVERWRNKLRKADYYDD